MNNNESDFLRILRLISQVGTNTVKAVQLYHRAMYDMVKRYLENPDRAIISNLYMPQEIFHAMDLPSIFIEYTSGTLASLKKTLSLIEIVEERIQTSGLCNYITCLWGLFEEKQLPPPKFFAISIDICEDSMKVCEYLSSRYNKEYFLLDLPFTHDTGDEKAVDYIAMQFEKLVKFLEKHTGEKLDNENLSRAIRLSNEARVLGKKIRDIRKSNKPLMSGFASIQMAGLHCLNGSQAAVNVLSNLYDELKERKESGYTPFPGAKYRIYWSHLFPPYATKISRYLEANLNAVLIGEEMFDVSKVELDERDPFRSLARRVLKFPGHGSLKNRVKNIVEEAIIHNADGIITFSPYGCRVGRGTVPLLTQECKKYGIPHLELMGDSIDFRNYSRAQMETRLEAFIEIIEELKEKRMVV